MSLFHRLNRLSVKKIFDAIVAMVRRFPLIVITTILGTSLGVYTIELGSVQNDALHIAQKVLLMAVLGIPVFLSLTLLCERFKQKEFIQWLLKLGSIVFLVGYYFLLPASPDDFSTPQIITMILLNVIFWLLVLSVPFFKRENPTAEWRYIETLVISFFITGIFSATLFAGLALSLWAVDYLFSVKWDEETYVQLWSVIVGIFASWFFLCRFPKQPQDLDKDFSFPAILRIFVQFILIPLLCIFYVILYAYTGKILVTWNWPLGGVAVWILAFSITGVVTYLIGQPMLKHNEYPWLKKFFSIFFALILPLTIVLFMAIGIRLKEYGVTEQRYLVVLFGVWLIAVALYYLISKKKEIKFVLLLTAAVFLLSLVGPWSMFSLSVRSQYNRLEKLLMENKILVDGQIQPVSDVTKIDKKVEGSIRSQIEFLADHGEVEKIQPWFTTDLKENPNHRVSIYSIEDNALKEIGLHQYPDYTYHNYFSYSSKTQEILLVGSYQYFIQEIRFPFYPANGTKTDEKYFDLGNRKIKVTFAQGVMRIYENNALLAEKNLVESVNALEKKYHAKDMHMLAPEETAFEIHSDKADIKMYISALSGNSDAGIEISSFTAQALVSLK